MLAIVCVLFAAGFWWLRKLSKIETPDRFLVHAPGAARPAGGAPGGRRARRSVTAPGHGVPQTLPGYGAPDAPDPSAVPGPGAAR